MVAKQTQEHLMEVAIEAFARDGFAKTSLRSIAKEAGVSPALVVHYFGSRDELIQQCISRSLGLWVAEKTELVDNSLSMALKQWQGSVAKHGQKLEFFRQVLIHGGDHANSLFSRMVQEAQLMLEAQAAQGKLKKLESLPDIALLMALHGLAPLVLRDQVNAHLGGDFLTPELAEPLAKANLEIYRKGIYKDLDKTSTKKKKTGKK
jgi:AcrR family transcriptional regulator